MIEKIFENIIVVGIVIFIVFGICIIKVNMGYKKCIKEKDYIIEKLKNEKQPKIVYVNHDNIQNNQLQEKYKKWILKHSSRCPNRIAELISREIVKYPYSLVLMAIIQRESNYNPFLTSSANARGLGQIRPFFYKNHKKIDVWENELKENGIINNSRDLYDPVINIKATNYIFMKYYNNTNDIKKTLYKYVGANYKKYVNDIFKIIGELYIFTRK